MDLYYRKTFSNQKGSALVVSLLILLVMTILGVQALSTTLLEEKMSGNYRDNQLAFEAAESALRAGEAWLGTHIVPPKPSDTGASGVWTFTKLSEIEDAEVKENYKLDAFWTANGVTVDTDLTLLSSDPGYLVAEQQRLSDDSETGSNAQEPRRYFYRVFARGVGGSSNSVVLLQTTYVRLF